MREPFNVETGITNRNPQESPYRALMAAILNRALDDAGTLDHGRDAKYFSKSDWCRELCISLDIPYSSFLKKFKEKEAEREEKRRKKDAERQEREAYYEAQGTDQEEEI